MLPTRYMRLALRLSQILFALCAAAYVASCLVRGYADDKHRQHAHEAEFARFLGATDWQCHGGCGSDCTFITPRGFIAATCTWQGCHVKGNAP